MAEPEGSLNIPNDSGSLPRSFQKGANEEQVRKHQNASQNNLYLNNIVLFYFQFTDQILKARLTPSFFLLSLPVPLWMDGLIRSVNLLHPEWKWTK